MSKGAKAIAALIFIFLVVAIFSSEGRVLFVAAVGGLVVFLGLWIENEADEEIKGEHLSSFTDDAKRLRVKYKRGWWILMVGIALEPVLNFL